MRLVKIRKKEIGTNRPCFISFEVGATWTNFNEAKKMIKSAAKSGADAIKFQTFLEDDSDRMMRKKDLTIEFKTFSGKKKENIYNSLKRRELSKNQWKELIDYSHNLGLCFISTAVFPETIDFLKKSGADALKIAKGDVNNVLLIEYASKTKLPIILDGREKFSDVEIGINICKKNKNNKIIIMHCPSGYPTENAGVHLRAITEIKKRYDLPVGFSDHSPNDIMNYAAIALGSNMIEKTITTNKKTEKVEHFMSLELDELKSFVEKIRAVEDALGDPNILNVSRVSHDARRCLVLKKDLKKGQKLTRNDLDYQRPGNVGISVSEGFSILGKKSKYDISKETLLKKNMFI